MRFRGLARALRLLGRAMSVIGFLALALGASLAVPLVSPPELASIHAGAQRASTAGLPDETRFHARDGTELAYRLYPAENGARDRLAIVMHGSAGSSLNMNVVSRTLAENGIAVAAIDARGHGGSGTRGDIAYIGQLDDDLGDLIAHLRVDYPAARLILIGHSAGGGFALRVAGEPMGQSFDRVVMLAPFLGYFAPTSRAAEGTARWAAADLPRIVALRMLGHLDIDWAQSLPVVAFAVPPGATSRVADHYSYRLLTNFGPPNDWRAAFAAARAPIDVIVGANDELMDAEQYPIALRNFAYKVDVRIIPGSDHMGILYQAPALAALLAAVEE